MSIYSINVQNLAGELVSLAAYKGKVLLIVNTATGCGLTPQYEGLEVLYQKLKPQGFEILDFPSNQFNNQAPDSSQTIHQICKGRFGITFTQFAKVDVNGKAATPLFKYLKTKKSGWLSRQIKWNFTKFLVDRNGNVVKRFAPTTSPAAMQRAIESLL